MPNLNDGKQGEVGNYADYGGPTTGEEKDLTLSFVGKNKKR